MMNTESTKFFWIFKNFAEYRPSKILTDHSYKDIISICFLFENLVSQNHIPEFKIKV